MTIMRVGTSVAMTLALLSCGGGTGAAGHVDISGKTPAEGATLAAAAVCSREARCGSVTIACMGGGSAGGNDASISDTCTATIRPIAYSGCYEDASGDIAELLSCASLTAEQVDMLEICFDMLAARKCVTQAEADARARATEGGSGPASEEPPPACALLTSPPPGC